jgi:8-oxo-dGTP pyrophosphatase MutT (NUDIX family)
MVIVKHSTASVFLMGWVEREWRLGLVWHPRFARWMLPGGHVEADENPAQAALREVMEETGVDAAILPARVAVAVPADVPGMVVAPLWIVEEQVPPEPRLPRAHVHVDCLYAAFASKPKPAAVGGTGSRGTARSGWDSLRCSTTAGRWRRLCSLAGRHCWTASGDRGLDGG